YSMSIISKKQLVRLLIVALALINLSLMFVVAKPVAAATTFKNPLNPDHGSDPYMTYFNGNYYLMTTTWSSTSSPGLTMKKASTINALIATSPVSIWQDTTASRCCNFWSPEFRLLNGPNGTRWYIYYVAGTSACCSNQFINVLESAGTDP